MINIINIIFIYKRKEEFIMELENKKYTHTYTSTHCQYRETVNLMCISNANVKDIMNEQISLAMKDIMNVKD